MSIHYGKTGPNFFSSEYLADSFNEDVYAEEILDTLEHMNYDFHSDSLSPPEFVDSVGSCPSTPPVKIPSLNADNVSRRRQSVSERRQSVSSHEEFCFSPFSFGVNDANCGDYDDGFDANWSPDREILNGVENTDKQWMNKILECLEKIHEGDEYKKKLNRTIQKFNRTAQKIAKVIISEAHLPVEEKTIAPVEVGGVGGEKYIYAGIFFKFAIDGQGIYGGDMFAAKAAGCELKAIRNIMEANIPGLHTPYMALIDYRGFRLMATTLLPISKETLKYGSDDGGRTIHNEDAKLTSLISQLGKKLNLKKHQVGFESPTWIYGPGI